MRKIKLSEVHNFPNLVQLVQDRSKIQVQLWHHRVSSSLLLIRQAVMAPVILRWTTGSLPPEGFMWRQVWIGQSIDQIAVDCVWDPGDNPTHLGCQEGHAYLIEKMKTILSKNWTLEEGTQGLRLCTGEKDTAGPLPGKTGSRVISWLMKQ